MKTSCNYPKQLEIPALAWFDYPLKGRIGSPDGEPLSAFLGFRKLFAAPCDGSGRLTSLVAERVVPQHELESVPMSVGLLTPSLSTRIYSKE